jgi:hypothetical protein
MFCWHFRRISVSRIACLLALFTTSLTAASNLELYFIDVDGGKSVLLVSPSGQSMLFDVGWQAFNNRPASAERIVEACRPLASSVSISW